MGSEKVYKFAGAAQECDAVPLAGTAVAPTAKAQNHLPEKLFSDLRSLLVFGGKVCYNSYSKGNRRTGGIRRIFRWQYWDWS